MRHHSGNFFTNEKLISAQSSLRLVGRQHRPMGSSLDINGIEIGGTELVVMAGPCAVESETQIMSIAQSVKASGAKILRGGAFKPRSSPYTFQGLKSEALKYLARAGRETGLAIITEVLDTRHLDLVCEYADIIQIGSRSMQNFSILEEVGKIQKPVLLKRGMCATLEEFLLAAEYIMKGGNDQIILCERGIRTFETSTRNTLDLNAVPMLKRLTHLPVIVDPSHGTGRWWMVPWLAKAAIAVGADGLIVEVHNNPGEALSDGPQSLTLEHFDQMMQELRIVAHAVGGHIGMPSFVSV